MRTSRGQEAGAPLLLCDADGNLFPSEEPAFAASAEVANALLAAFGSSRRYGPEELRREALGRSFRSTAAALLQAEGHEIGPEELESWVEREKQAVTAQLLEELKPNKEVTSALDQLQDRFRLAVVTSSAASRLAASLAVTGLTAYFPSEVRFSAEDSLPVPKSKPDPAVYEFALASLREPPERALAIEDSPAGVESAAAAGLAVAGNLAFAPADERRARAADLLSRGAFAVLDSWSELAALAGRWQPASKSRS